MAILPEHDKLRFVMPEGCHASGQKRPGKIVNSIDNFGFINSYFISISVLLWQYFINIATV